MIEKFKYFIRVSQDSEEVERSEGTIAYFANPVGKGDTVYWGGSVANFEPLS